MGEISTATAHDSKSDFDKEDPKAQYDRWAEAIKLSEKEQQAWVNRSIKIIERYKQAKRSDSDLGPTPTKFNILWSNVQTMRPSLYARTPKPEIERRFRDRDPLGRAAAMILERATEFVVDSYDFDSFMKDCVLDFLLPGRGQGWIRYIPHVEKLPIRIQLTQDAMVSNEGGDERVFHDEAGKIYNAEGVLQDETGFYAEETYDNVNYEEVICDYIHWQDFLHEPARRWDEVSWVARRVYMTREKLIERFGEEIGNEVKLDHVPDYVLAQDSYDADKVKQQFKRGVVWEIWDKDSRIVKWLSPGYQSSLLDEKPDPLGLKNFFPCPKPLLATTTTDSLIPVPDFVMYDKLADQLDEITTRISYLQEAIRVAGVYDASLEGIQKLLTTSGGNLLIPVQNWPQYVEAGGFKGAVDFLPLDQIVNALTSLYQVHATLKNEIYELTGISDIIRGATSPEETATAQQIKGQYATIRLSDRQSEIQRFARDLIRIKAEIIAEHFSPETLRLMAGVDMIDSEMIQEAAPAPQLPAGMPGMEEQMPEMEGQLPGAEMQLPPPMPMAAPNRVDELFEEAVGLLRHDVLRSYRIDIETDSTIAFDENVEKERRNEFLQALATFMKTGIEVVGQVPAFGPVMGEALLFGVRGYKAGRSLESAIETAITQINEQQKASENAPPPPDPEMLKLEQEKEMRMMEFQMKQQGDAQKSQVEAQAASERLQAEMSLERENMMLTHEREIEKIRQEGQFELQKIQAEKEVELIKYQNMLIENQQEQLRQASIPAPVPAKVEKAEPVNITIQQPGNRRGVISDGPNGTRIVEIQEAALEVEPSQPSF